MLCNIKTSLPYYNDGLQPVVDSSLFLWLTADLGTATVWQDRSGQNNNANASTGATRYSVHQSGIFGNGYALNGTNGYIGIPDSPAFDVSAITLEAWINASSFTGISRAIIWRDTTASPTRFFQVYVSTTGNLVFNYRNTLNAYSIITSNTIIPTNTLTHIACSCANAGNMNMYINGIKEFNSIPFVGTMNTGIASMYIGSGHQGTQYWFSGKIPEVRAYSRQLSDTEIDFNYRNSYSYYINEAI